MSINFNNAKIQQQNLLNEANKTETLRWEVRRQCNFIIVNGHPGHKCVEWDDFLTARYEKNKVMLCMI